MIDKIRNHLKENWHEMDVCGKRDLAVMDWMEDGWNDDGEWNDEFEWYDDHMNGEAERDVRRELFSDCVKHIDDLDESENNFYHDTLMTVLRELYEGIEWA